MRIAARAPNHLGDGVMALPALGALAAAHELTIYAPRWGQDLYGHLPAAIVPIGSMQAEVAVLFAPSLRAAREARGVPRVIGTATDHRRWWLTDAVEPSLHCAQTFARLVGALGLEVRGAPIVPLRGTAAEVPDGHIGLNPVCKSGSTREWTGFFALACALERPVVFYAGPGEHAALDRRAGGFPRLCGLSLPDLASTLQRCAVFVSNDGGAAHFARAVGVPTLVVHGSTSAAQTGPAGAFAIEGPEVPCWPCYRSRCPHDLACLEIGVDRVHRAVTALL